MGGTLLALATLVALRPLRTGPRAALSHVASVTAYCRQWTERKE